MTTSQAAQTFAEAIKDAENLLGHFDTLNTQPPPSELEVFKRAGLFMAMTAWETYLGIMFRRRPPFACRV